MPARCVLVVDEAGMVPTRELAELVDAVLAVEGKVVLVGDHRQLPELQAGGTFRALVQRGLALELRDNVRQVHAWEREALDQLRDGEPEHALAAYVRHDRVTIEPTADATRARLVEDWFAAGDPAAAVMIAHRRADVAELNARARERCARRERSGPSSTRRPDVRRRRPRRRQAQRHPARHQQRRPRPRPRVDPTRGAIGSSVGDAGLPRPALPC